MKKHKQIERQLPLIQGPIDDYMNKMNYSTNSMLSDKFDLSVLVEIGRALVSELKEETD